MIEIEFFGVRGSTPCSCSSTVGVGGNTSCVVLHCGSEDPIILDLGTGVRYLGDRLKAEQLEAQRLDPAAPVKAFQGTALVTHLHWDHVQGLPFFVPLLNGEAELVVVGPAQEEGTLQEAVQSFVRPPLFPVDLHVLPGTVDFVETSDARLTCGSVEVLVRPVEHIGPTNGYRIDYEEGSVAYIPDHQQPIDGSMAVSDSVLELCRDVDVLIHDAQYDEEDFANKKEWGHSTVSYAVEVAVQAGARRLVLFHHDPSHSDDWVAQAVIRANEMAGGACEVLAAREKLVLVSGDHATIQTA